ncbi:alpha/beta hydrolase [[Clostridium] dakarense]|uniref:alpha/beta hydrolase n=1 Tax=Faecalimicrobium dakarense TaxID=1301100 RepID=UPI0004B32AA3|nr:alpha/beta hydrolase-fold protein [[Clostridium] dakarense]
MKGIIVKEIIKDREVFIYLPTDYNISNKDYPVVYIQDGDEIIKHKEEFFCELEKDDIKFIGVLIPPKNRLNEYTPWYSEGLSEKTPDFLGDGDKYLNFLCNDIKKIIDSKYRTKKDKKSTSIIGASLGGLISVYALYTKSDIFGSAVCVSGSFWYKDILKFLEESEINIKDKKIFMSIGEDEDHCKSKYYDHIHMLDNNLKAYEILKLKCSNDNVYIKIDKSTTHCIKYFLPNLVLGIKWI